MAYTLFLILYVPYPVPYTLAGQNRKLAAAEDENATGVGTAACLVPLATPVATAAAIAAADEAKQELLRKVAALELQLNASSSSGGSGKGGEALLAAARAEADRLRALLEDARESFGAAVTERDHAVVAAETTVEPGPVSVTHWS
jgi:hypothetical protein